MRQALHEVCGLKWAQAAKFNIHGLRVGGINFYRRLGVPIEACAEIASHKSVHTARLYLRQLPYEQLNQLKDTIGI